MTDQPGGKTTKTARGRAQEIHERLTEIEADLKVLADDDSGSVVQLYRERDRLDHELSELRLQIRTELKQEHTIKEVDQVLNELPNIRLAIQHAAPTVIAFLSGIASDLIGLETSLEEVGNQSIGLRAKHFHTFRQALVAEGFSPEGALQIVCASVGQPDSNIGSVIAGLDNLKKLRGSALGRSSDLD